MILTRIKRAWDRYEDPYYFSIHGALGLAFFMLFAGLALFVLFGIHPLKDTSWVELWAAAVVSLFATSTLGLHVLYLMIIGYIKDRKYRKEMYRRYPPGKSSSWPVN